MLFVRGDYKLIITHGVDSVLYNIRRDPEEMNNLINKEPDLYRKLAKKLAKWEKNECIEPSWLEEGWRKITNRYHQQLMHNEIKTAQDLYKKKIDNLLSIHKKKRRMRHLYFPILAGGCMFVSALHAQNERPNIVFIMADDLGWNDLGITGSDYYETPNIDKLASEGVFFDNAYAAAANSAPSRACFMTGLYTPRHGVYTVSPSARGDKTKRKLIPITNTEDVRTDLVTLGEALKQQGYVCGHIGKWHLGSDLDGSKTGPLSQGFDYNIAGDRAGSPYSYFYPYCRKQKCHLGLDEGSEGEYLTDRLTSEAIKFVEQTKDKPFFLYMAHHAVHTPLKAPQTLVDKYQKKTKGKYQTNAIYAAMVENLDWNVGRLCHAIDSLGLSENTLIVFYSDNGGAAAATNNFRLRGAKGMPYEGGIRVPLIMKYPRKIKSGNSSFRTCNRS